MGTLQMKCLKNPFNNAIQSDARISGRHLGGYQGGLEMKRALLEKEGIPFDDTGRVACAQFHYERIILKLPHKLNQ